MGKGRGLSRRGVFIFFFLWLGEEKKIKIPIPSQHKSMFAPNPASRGRLGQADLKGQREAERRGWGESQWQWGWCEDAQAEKKGVRYP